MFLDDHITLLRAELGIELAAPGSGLERLQVLFRKIHPLDVNILPLVFGFLFEDDPRRFSEGVERREGVETERG